MLDDGRRSAIDSARQFARRDSVPAAQSAGLNSGGVFIELRERWSAGSIFPMLVMTSAAPSLTVAALPVPGQQQQTRRRRPILGLL